MNDTLHDWLENIGARHGFTGPGAPGASGSNPSASSRADATFEALDAEAHGLFERARRLVEDLRTAVSPRSFDDYVARVNSFNGRLRDPANEENAQEVRRVITDLRETIADFEQRLREVDRGTDRTIEDLAAGRGQRAAPSEEPTPDGGDGSTPSDDADASFADLERQARTLFRRATTTLDDMRIGLPDGEQRSLVARLDAFNGRINDPALRGNAQEMRRVVTDLYAVAQDLESRRRELERAPDEMARDLAAGRGLGRTPNLDDAVANASSRADATFEALDAEARGLHRRARQMLEDHASGLSRSEQLEQVARLNTIFGRVEDPANEGDAQEMRRVIADLRAILQDLAARLRTR